MSYSERYTCDICGAEKQQTNHWFEVRQSFTGIHSLLLTPFMGNRGTAEHICSSGCLAQRVHQFEESLREQQKGS